MSKLAIIREFWQFLRLRKKWWLLPIVIILFLFGALIIFFECPVVPSVYVLF